MCDLPFMNRRARMIAHFRGRRFCTFTLRGGAAMWKTIGTITTLALALICAAVPAQAQTERVFETITDLLRGGQQLQGYVVVIHDADMVVQAKDGRIYTISTAEMDRSQLSRLHPGKQVR